MKKNIDILLAHLQKEHDYLETEMNLCIAEWDFLGAETYRKPLRLVKSKLEVAKSLKNPQHRIISRLETMISLEHRRLDSFETNDKDLDKKLSNFLKKDSKKRIRELKKEIRKLKSIKPVTYIQGNTLEKLLEQLAKEEVSLIDIDLFQEKVALQVRREGTSLKLDLIPAKDMGIRDFILDVNMVSLKKLGFDETTFELEIENFQITNTKKIMEILSILFFEVVNLTGTINVKIQ